MCATVLQMYTSALLPTTAAVALPLWDVYKCSVTHHCSSCTPTLGCIQVQCYPPLQQLHSHFGMYTSAVLPTTAAVALPLWDVYKCSVTHHCSSCTPTLGCIQVQCYPPLQQLHSHFGMYTSAVLPTTAAVALPLWDVYKCSVTHHCSSCTPTLGCIQVQCYPPLQQLHSHFGEFTEFDMS